YALHALQNHHGKNLNVLHSFLPPSILSVFQPTLMQDQSYIQFLFFSSLPSSYIDSSFDSWYISKLIVCSSASTFKIASFTKSLFWIPTIFPASPESNKSTALAPNRLARTRSAPVGDPPRCR